MTATPEAILEHWRREPFRFVRDAFGASPEPWQKRVLDAFPLHQRLALQACKGPGKTATLAWLVWNFLLTRPQCKVACTSVTGPNLFDCLWTELAKWYAVSPVLQHEFEIGGERIVQRRHPKTWWCSARTWPKDANPKAQADALAGLHADRILFVIDEAGGVPDGVVVTAEAALANSELEGNEARLVCAGNPTEPTGPLYRAATSERALWWRIEITADPDAPDRAQRVSKAWALAMIERYGRDDDWTRVNVFGMFPRQGTTQFIGLDLCEDALAREADPKDYSAYPHILALDVARFGDDESVLCRRQGRKVWPLVGYRGLDLMELVGRLGEACEPADPRLRPQAIFIDEGGLGAGVVDRAMQLGFRVQGVNFGSKPVWPQAGEPPVPNRRCEMWAKLRAHMSSLCLPRGCPELVRDLTAPKYRYDKESRLCIESKDEMKKRGLPSPDWGDALALTYAAPVASRFDELHRGGHARTNHCVTELSQEVA